MKQKKNLKKLIILNIPYIVIGLVATNVGEAFRIASGTNASEKVQSVVLDGCFGTAFSNPMPSFHPIDLIVGLAIGGILRLAVYIKSKNAKKFRHNQEYGSARWGTHADIEPYMDPVFANNVILSQTERLTMNNRPANPKYARNKNTLVVGGSGSGKTRFFIKPNLLQLHSSYVLTDPKGTVLPEVGNALLKNGYRIKIFNTINFKKSMHYNPFAYVHDEKDILKLVTTLIANTKGEGKGGDEFWEKAEKLLYSALIGYIHYEAPEEEQNFSTLLEMINAMEVREDDEEFKNPVDLMFDELAERDPDHFAVRQYAKYKLSAGKTAKSILVSCGARLAPFDIKELREITAYDELELDTLGDKKTALFLIMLYSFDGFILIHRLNMHGHDLAGLHVEEICQHPVGNVRCIDGQKAHCPVKTSHRKSLSSRKRKAARCDKIFYGKTGPEKILPIEIELLPVSHMELLMHKRQSFFTVKDSRLNSKSLEVIQDVRLDMDDPGLCRLDGIRMNSEGQKLCLRETVVSCFHLMKEHGTVFISDSVELILSMRNRDAGTEVIHIRCHVHKTQFEVYRAVKKVKECTPFLENLCLILLQCKLIVDILELDRLRVIITSDPADTVLKHSVKRDRLLCRSGNAVIPTRLLDNASYLFLLSCGQICGKL